MPLMVGYTSVILYYTFFWTSSLSINFISLDTRTSGNEGIAETFKFNSVKILSYDHFYIRFIINRIAISKYENEACY